MALGGGVWVGLEDNIRCDSGRSRLATNADLLRRDHSLAQIHERSVMKPTRLRDLLKLAPSRWSGFASSCGVEGDPLPAELRKSVSRKRQGAAEASPQISPGFVARVAT